MQTVKNHTGFLVNSPEGAALRVCYLIDHLDELQEMGQKARDFARENFPIIRHLREYLTVIVALTHGCQDRIELE